MLVLLVTVEIEANASMTRGDRIASSGSNLAFAEECILSGYAALMAKTVLLSHWLFPHDPNSEPRTSTISGNSTRSWSEMRRRSNPARPRNPTTAYFQGLRLPWWFFQPHRESRKVVDIQKGNHLSVVPPTPLRNSFTQNGPEFPQ
jgi:hypothetical protein